MIYSFFQALFSVVDMVIGLYIGIIFIEAIFSWMVSYDIISNKDKKMDQVKDMLNKLTAPFLNKIRKHLPLVGGLDFSPIVAILVLVFIQKFLRAYGLSI
jgi:YggT family protein